MDNKINDLLNRLRSAAGVNSNENASAKETEKEKKKKAEFLFSSNDEPSAPKDADYDDLYNGLVSINKSAENSNKQINTSKLRKIVKPSDTVVPGGDITPAPTKPVVTDPPPLNGPTPGTEYWVMNVIKTFDEAFNIDDYSIQTQRGNRDIIEQLVSGDKTKTFDFEYGESEVIIIQTNTPSVDGVKTVKMYFNVDGTKSEKPDEKLGADGKPALTPGTQGTAEWLTSNFNLNLSDYTVIKDDAGVITQLKKGNETLDIDYENLTVTKSYTLADNAASTAVKSVVTTFEAKTQGEGENAVTTYAVKNEVTTYKDNSTLTQTGNTYSYKNGNNEIWSLTDSCTKQNKPILKEGNLIYSGARFIPLKQGDKVSIDADGNVKIENGNKKIFYDISGTMKLDFTDNRNNKNQEPKLSEDGKILDFVNIGRNKNEIELKEGDIVTINADKTVLIENNRYIEKLSEQGKSLFTVAFDNDAVKEKIDLLNGTITVVNKNGQSETYKIQEGDDINISDDVASITHLNGETVTFDMVEPDTPTPVVPKKGSTEWVSNLMKGLEESFDMKNYSVQFQKGSTTIIDQLISDTKTFKFEYKDNEVVVTQTNKTVGSDGVKTIKMYFNNDGTISNKPIEKLGVDGKPVLKAGEKGTFEWVNEKLMADLLTEDMLDSSKYTINRDSQGRIVGVVPKSSNSALPSVELSYNDGTGAVTYKQTFVLGENANTTAISSIEYVFEAKTEGTGENTVTTYVHKESKTTYKNRSVLFMNDKKAELKNSDGEVVWSFETKATSTQNTPTLDMEAPIKVKFVQNSEKALKSYEIQEGDTVTVNADGSVKVINDKTTIKFDKYGNEKFHITDDCELENKPVLSSDEKEIICVTEGLGSKRIAIADGDKITIDSDGNIHLERGNKITKINSTGNNELYSVTFEESTLEEKPVLNNDTIVFVNEKGKAPKTYPIQNGDVITVSADGKVTIINGETVKVMNINGNIATPDKKDNVVQFGNGETIELEDNQTVKTFEDKQVIAIITSENGKATKVEYYDYEKNLIGSIEDLNGSGVPNIDTEKIATVIFADGSKTFEKGKITINSDGTVSVKESFEKGSIKVEKENIYQSKNNPSKLSVTLTDLKTGTKVSILNVPNGLDVSKIESFFNDKINGGLTVTTNDKQFIFLKDDDKNTYNFVMETAKDDIVEFFTDDSTNEKRIQITSADNTTVTTYDANGNKVGNSVTTDIGSKEWFEGVIDGVSEDDYTFITEGEGDDAVITEIKPKSGKDGSTYAVAIDKENDKITITETGIKDGKYKDNPTSVVKVYEGGKLSTVTYTYNKPETNVEKRVVTTDAKGNILESYDYDSAGNKLNGSLQALKNLYDTIVITGKNTTLSNMEKALRALSDVQKRRIMDFNQDGKLTLDDVKILLVRQENEKLFEQLNSKATAKDASTKFDTNETNFLNAFKTVLYEYIVNDGKYNADGTAPIKVQLGNKLDIEQRAKKTTGIVNVSSTASKNGTPYTSTTALSTSNAKYYVNGELGTGWAKYTDTKNVEHNVYFVNGTVANGVYEVDGKMKLFNNGLVKTSSNANAISQDTITKLYFNSTGELANGKIGTSVYKNGAKLTGTWATDKGGDGKFYSNGTLLTGVYNNVYYKSGIAFTSTSDINGVRYDADGKPTTGNITISNKVYYYENGYKFTGITKDGKQYVDGIEKNFVENNKSAISVPETFENYVPMTVLSLFYNVNNDKAVTESNATSYALTKDEMIKTYLTTTEPNIKKVLSYFVDNNEDGSVTTNKYFSLVAKNGTYSSTSENSITLNEFLTVLCLKDKNSLITEESLKTLENNLKQYEFLASGLNTSATQSSKIYNFDYTSRTLDSLPVEYQTILSPMYDENGNPNLYAWNLLAGKSATSTSGTIDLKNLIIGEDKTKDYFANIARAAKIMQVIDNAGYNINGGYIQEKTDNTITTSTTNAASFEKDTLLQNLDYLGLNFNDKECIKLVLNEAFMHEKTTSVKSQEFFNIILRSLQQLSDYTGIKDDGKQYFNGKVAQGEMDNKLYDDGKLSHGLQIVQESGKIYIDGIKKIAYDKEATATFNKETSTLTITKGGETISTYIWDENKKTLTLKKS